MTAVTWVVGAGGLLGSAVVRALASDGRAVFSAPRVAWGTARAGADLDAGLASFIRAAHDGSWQIFWCAGAAVTDSSAETLTMEVRTLQHLLDRIEQLPAATVSRGSFVFASSAGAVYGGSTNAPFTESSTPVPLGAYGAAKLRAEEMLHRSAAVSRLPVLVLRIANVYGPGQSLTKQQGLVSRLCLSAVTRTPISVFVSLDTLRDYIYVDDCARQLVAGGRRLAHSEDLGGWHLKITCSGRAVPVATLLGLFHRLPGPKPLVVMGISSAATLQRRDLRLKSTYWTSLDAGPSTTLASGIDRVMKDMMLNVLQSGRYALTG